jgi:2-dehydropantoate 2-reductase
MKIAVIGAGGVGGYFGGRLAAAGEDVHFVARGAHLQAMQSSGLRIYSPKGDLTLANVNATDDPSTIGPSDIVLFTVKMYDVESAAALLPPLLHRDTAVITLQNGVEAVDILSRFIPRSNVVGGVAYVASVITEPGVIRHTALDTLIFGEADGTRSERLVRFAEAGTRAGFQTKLSEHIDVDLWGKFARLSVFSAMTAVTRSPLGVIREDPDLVAMMKAALQESLQVARAHGVPLDEAVLKEIMAMVAGMPPQSKSSMLEDLERGRRLELPWLSGAVVRLGREANVPTPIHQFIATVLKPFVNGSPAADGPQMNADARR